MKDNIVIKLHHETLETMLFACELAYDELDAEFSLDVKHHSIDWFNLRSLIDYLHNLEDEFND